jgi:hypothetical protein
LRAFGSEDPARLLGSKSEFPALLRQAERRAGSLEADITAALDEVDRPQAELFARRFRSVFRILNELAAAEAPYYRVALVCRVAEIIEAARPRALRVRAACDFYYSQAALLHHAGSKRAVEEILRAASWRELEPGLSHARVEGDSRLGPLHLNLLRLREGNIRSVDCREQDFARFVESSGAKAAVSGGFFLYSEPDISPPSRRGDPVGMLLDGELRPPVFRRATLLQRGGRFSIERTGLSQVELHIAASVLRVDAVNDAARLGSGLVAFNRAYARELDWHHTLSIVDREVVAGASPAPVAIPLSGFVLALPNAPPSDIEVGMPVHYEMPGPPLEAAMAGGPLLLGERALDLAHEDFAGSAPPLTFSADETFDQNLLPRMGVGLTADGELIFCAVDGRNFDRAPGLTLGMTADCLAALGCVRAMNLDGGGSKRVVVEGEVVDLPSTEVVHGEAQAARVRPVRSGILLYGRR